MSVRVSKLWAERDEFLGSEMRYSYTSINPFLVSIGTLGYLIPSSV